MFKTFATRSLLAFALTMPIAAHAQVGSPEDTEATSAILDAGQTAGQIRQLRQVPSVGVINIQYGYAAPRGSAGNETRMLEGFASHSAPGISLLRRALQGNPVTRQAMAEHGVNVGRVIGVSVGGSGSLRFFVD